MIKILLLPSIIDQDGFYDRESKARSQIILKAYRKRWKAKGLDGDFDDVYFKKSPLHLGLVDIGSFVKKRGAKVTYLPLNVIPKNQLDTVLKRYLKNVDWVGANSFTPTMAFSKNILTKVKKINSQIKTAMGGNEVSYNPQRALKFIESLDFVVRGEGEIAFYNLIKEEHPISKIKGIAYKNRVNDGVGINNFAEPLKTMRDKSLPDFSIIPTRYRDHVSAHLMWAFGCPFSCAFCSEHNFFMTKAGKVRYKTAKMCIDELEIVNKELGQKVIHIADSTFIVRNRNYEDLFGEFKKRKLNVYLSINARADYLPQELVKRLVNELNVFEIWVGQESGNEQVLQRVRKGVSVKQGVANLEKIKHIVPFLNLYLTIGLPGEDERSIRDTKRMLYNLRKDGVIFMFSSGIYSPTPGSEIYRNPCKYGITFLDQKYSSFTRYGKPNFKLNDMPPERIFKEYQSLEQINIKYLAN